MKNYPDYTHLCSDTTSLIVDCRRQTPIVLYWGSKLSDTTLPSMLGLLCTRQEAKCALVVETPISLSPCLGDGFTGQPALDLFNDGLAWSAGAKLIDVKQANKSSVIFLSVDEVRDISLEHRLDLDYETNVLSASTSITNQSTTKLNVNYCAAPTFTMPDHINKILSFEGRWSMEFQTNSIDLFLGAFVRENRKGKTSHDNWPGVVLHAEHTNEQQGECYGYHLGWSGNHRTRVELLPEQRTYVQMGELLGNGEISLEKDQTYTSPTLYVSYSQHGFSALSHNFHRFVRKHILSDRITKMPRPIHYNTWEGIYFDHDVTTLKQLANIMSNAGAERFVLDDGWFLGRRNDNAGLGDWVVDKSIYPDGLNPIIEHVNDLGMAFGIWFEPEMVNPNSELYRAHPDWVLSTTGNPQIDFRNQLVLDLTRSEVCDYLFEQISDVLTEYPQITYIKWDMNRDINHTGNAKGISAIHNQTKAVYALIDRVKHAHPKVEIESCSSGGARVDYGVLAHTDRIWTSDSNDALDRLMIQRGCSFFFPSEIMGSHVGPRECHITGRQISLETRIAVAFFGSMGMEMDPRELSDDDIAMLQSGTQLYKDYRHLIHSGRLYRSELNGHSVDFGIVSDDKSTGLFAYNSVVETRRTMPRKYRFDGLDKAANYKLNMIWPTQLKEYSSSILSVVEDQIFSGEALMKFGMQLPIVFPQTSLIFKLSKQ
ncbi:alpha-galactosidase [Glaciecola petra]|uniref:Alpha-galactosidase n=1 Tax=Glaciecola petra TaxID=3075602 RepID=A0ABU2ZTU0_9ALTE|nr:alpha-galactosidase [Aestuariibacter sp. P117]MDT0596069.1 alpha-galactosidase [Aestuariibacter sp. P117]